MHEIVIKQPSGETDYYAAVFKNDAGTYKVNINGTDTWEVFNDANIATYAIDLIERGDESGTYTGTFPQALPALLYDVAAYKGNKEEGTLQDSLGINVMNWDGSAELFPNTTVPDTAETIADAVWDESLTGATHNIPTSAGRRLRDLASNVIITGTSPNTAGTANTAIRIELDADASSDDGCYDPSNILIYAGTGIGQSRQIWEYDGTNKYAYINRDWRVIPDNTSKYIIYGSSGNTHINEGLCGGGSSNTIILNTLAKDDDDIYVGQIVFLAAGIGQDQAAGVISYDGATHTATLEKSWEIIPTNGGTVYSVMPWTHATVAEIREEIDANSTELAAIKAIVENIVAVAPINVSHTSNVVHRS